MKMTEIQSKLANIVVDLNAVAMEMYSRGMEADMHRLEEALTNVGQVCTGFLDEKALASLPTYSSDWERPCPGEAPTAPAPLGL